MKNSVSLIGLLKKWGVRLDNDALAFACMHSKPEVVELLIRYGADVYRDDSKPIKNAIEYNDYPDVLEVLFKHKAHLQSQLQLGYTMEKYKLVQDLCPEWFEEFIRSRLLDALEVAVDTKDIPLIRFLLQQAGKYNVAVNVETFFEGNIDGKVALALMNQ